MRTLVLMILLSLVTSVSAKQLPNALGIDGTTRAVDPIDHTLYFEDKEHLLTFSDIQGRDYKNWHTIPDRKAAFGFSDNPYWLTFKLNNKGKSPLDLYLHINYALIDRIELKAYSENSSLREHDESYLDESYIVGDTLPFTERPIDHPTFLLPISLDAGETKQIVIKAASKGPIQLPMKIWNSQTFLLEAKEHTFLYGSFLSALLIMSAYYIALFLMVKDKNYLLYSLYILAMAGVHASLDGYTYQWLWPSATDWHQMSTIVFISLGLIATVFFTRALLPIPKKSWIDTLTKSLGIAAVISAVLSPFIPYKLAAMMNGGMTVIVMSGVAITCIAMLKHSPRIAKFFCYAWSAYFVGILLKSSSKLGYLPSNFLTEYSGNLGAVIGIVIIALALADRINTEKKAKEKAQFQSIKNLKRFETLFENALEGIFTLAEDGSLLSANPAFMKLIGLKNTTQFDGDWCKLDGYRLEGERFEQLLSSIKQQGKVVDYETQMTREDGAFIWVNISARYVIDTDNQASFEGTLINISERKAFEQQLQHLAEHDSLTGFFNRRAFEASAKDRLNKVQNYEDTCCLLYIDLDQFKIVNDLCGHTAGDLLLKNLSQRLLELVKSWGEHQLIARLGGDEFGVLLSKTSLPKAREAAENIRMSVEEFLFVWEGKRYTVGASIGLVELLPYHDSVEQLLVMADTACYMAKDQGRNRVHTFIESDKELQFRQLEMQWVSTIKEALAKDQFFLVFQNIVQNKDSRSGEFHYEILIRLMNNNGNLCAPNQFLPAAERYNLMPNIDRWVVTSYFSWLKQNTEHLENLTCASINLSTQSIGDEAFSHFLLNAFDEFGIPPNKICFEITEGMAITHLDNTQSFIERFRSLGCRFALDDFGTGFSSYAYLKQLKVDYIKIDGVFIKNLCDDEVNLAMVKSISDVAKAIGIETVAEFVENADIESKLREIGITYSQGYHIHKPVKLENSAFSISDVKQINSNSEVNE